MTKSRATIHDVSRIAGVSISSVSRVINGQTSTPDIVSRVQAAIEDVGYVPNALARSLKKQRVGQIAFAVEDIGNPAYLAMVRAIEPIVGSAGLRLVLMSTGAVVSEEVEVVRSLRQRFVDGLIICPIRPDEQLLKEIESSESPIVVIGSLPRAIATDNVAGDSRMGARFAVEHLLQQGARRIGLITGSRETVPGRMRSEGFESALRGAGCFDPTLVREVGGFGFADGVRAARSLVDESIDAVVGATDMLALSAMHAASAAGLKVPEDLRVVGIDNSEVALTALPPLSSVDLGATERGRLAAEMLLSRFDAPSISARSVVVPPRLVVRQSSR